MQFGFPVVKGGGGMGDASTFACSPYAFFSGLTLWWHSRHSTNIVAAHSSTKKSSDSVTSLTSFLFTLLAFLVLALFLFTLLAFLRLLRLTFSGFLFECLLVVMISRVGGSRFCAFFFRLRITEC